MFSGHDVAAAAVSRHREAASGRHLSRSDGVFTRLRALPFCVWQMKGFYDHDSRLARGGGTQLMVARVAWAFLAGDSATGPCRGLVITGRCLAS